METMQIVDTYSTRQSGQSGCGYWVEQPRTSIINWLRSLPVGETVTHNRIYDAYVRSSHNPSVRGIHPAALHRIIDEILQSQSFCIPGSLDESTLALIKRYGGRNPYNPDGKLLRDNRDFTMGVDEEGDPVPNHDGTYTVISPTLRYLQVYTRAESELTCVNPECNQAVTPYVAWYLDTWTGERLLGESWSLCSCGEGAHGRAVDLYAPFSYRNEQEAKRALAVCTHGWWDYDDFKQQQVEAAVS